MKLRPPFNPQRPTALFLGRYQPFHRGHQRLIEGDLSLDAFGFNRGLLHLEAKYSHQKRMEKIEAVLCRTLDLLGSERDTIVRAFAQACPPTSIGRLDNARQFYAFLGRALARARAGAAVAARYRGFRNRLCGGPGRA